MPVSRYHGNQPVLPPTTNTESLSQPPTGTSSPTTLPSSLNTSSNRWEVGGTTGTELSPAVREKADSAINQYNSQIRTILHHDAMSLAEGHTPVRSGDALTDTQRNQLTDATKDMLMGMPIGALSPQMTSELRNYLDRQGVSTDRLETKTLGELGSVGGELAKKWADEFKDKSPGAFYGLLATAGAAVGAYGYLQGSDGLKDLGIKPEFKTKLFGDHLSVKAEAMWGKKFSDPNLRADIQGSYRLSDLTLRGNVNVDARNLDATHGSVGARWGNDHTHLDAQVNGSVNNGIDTIRLSGRYGNENYHVYGNATLTDNMNLREANVGGAVRFDEYGSARMNVGINGDGRVSTVSGSFDYTRDNYFVRGSANADLINRDHSVEIRGGYRPNDNLELGVIGGYNSNTGSRVGVGLTWNF